MKKFTFFLAAILFAGFSMADEYTHTFAKGELGETLAAGTVTLSGVEWTVEHEGGNYAGWDSNYGKGVQIGKGNAPCTSYVLKTSAFNGNIKKVIVNSSVASGGVSTVSILVGETSYLADQSLTTTATDYSGTGTASGELQISLANTGLKAMYIKSIKVEYGDANAPSISADDIDFGSVNLANTNTQTLTVTGENLTDAITATLKEGTAFSVAGSLTATGGTLTIMLTATAEGTYTDVLTLKSGAATKEVNISAKAVELQGVGTEENPYTVSDVFKLNNPNTQAWVKGYIIGVVADGSYDNLQTSEIEVASNLVLADDPAATTDYICVQLPNKSIIRGLLNLVDHPNLVGAQVAIQGNLEAYFGKPGVKSPTESKILSISTALENITIENNTTKTIINGQVHIIREGKTFTLMGQEVK